MVAKQIVLGTGTNLPTTNRVLINVNGAHGCSSRYFDWTVTQPPAADAALTRAAHEHGLLSHSSTSIR
jgi:hypothetical protein